MTNTDYDLQQILSINSSLGRPIYHTNVFMAITRNLVIICLAAVKEEERAGIEDALKTPQR